MPSAAYKKFYDNLVSAQVLRVNVGLPCSACSDQSFVDQTLLKAAIASAVGCWEGYIEAVIREFVLKIRLQSHRNAWGLISQYELIVDKKASSLNTPNWDKARELIIEVTGMDPYSGWIWLPKFTNQNDTKNFFDGIMLVRHAFAHGFDVPQNIPGLSNSRLLDQNYASESINCIEFFVAKTDELLEHELRFRHACRNGWN